MVVRVILVLKLYLLELPVSLIPSEIYDALKLLYLSSKTSNINY